MLQKIEMWKVLIIIVQSFCFGGYLFCEEDRQAKTVLGLILAVFGIAVCCVI